jgi:hypothetical protein
MKIPPPAKHSATSGWWQHTAHIAGKKEHISQRKTLLIFSEHTALHGTVKSSVWYNFGS